MRDYAELGRLSGLNRQNPIKSCVLCLYRVGYGYKAIARLTATKSHALCRKWIIKAGIKRDGGWRRSTPGITPGGKARLVAARQKQRAEAQVRQNRLWEFLTQAKVHFIQPPETIEQTAARLEREREKASEYFQRNKKVYRDRARRVWLERRGDLTWRAGRRKQHREWIRRNPGYSSQWAKANPEKFREAQRKQRRKPSVKVANNLRKRINDLIGKGARVGSTEKLIGCSRLQFIQHIERQFSGRMSWDNYGRWHIDHIVPCAKFNLTSQEDRLTCFHWTNLRPMWAKANIKKGARLINAQLGLPLSLTAA
jgi:hypothetical protein